MAIIKHKVRVGLYTTGLKAYWPPRRIRFLDISKRGIAKTLCMILLVAASAVLPPFADAAQQDATAHLRNAGSVAVPESALAMVPQTGAKMVQIAGEPRHVSIWDYNISPGGEHYFSICAEGTVSEYARLYRYYPEMNEARRVFRLEDVIGKKGLYKLYCICLTAGRGIW